MIEAVADDNSFFELQAEYAANIVTGYIRLNGKTVGVVANQPLLQSFLLYYTADSDWLESN